MRIDIAAPCVPFSHVPGTELLLPKSSWQVAAYPTKITLTNLALHSSREPLDLLLHLVGVVDSFTLVQNLDKGWIRILGKEKRGYFSYRLTASSEGIVLLVERCTAEGIVISWEGSNQKLYRGQSSTILANTLFASPHSAEKMHFGSFKKQDWTLVKRRQSLEEIFPVWFALGKEMPKYPVSSAGTALYLERCKRLVEQRDRNHIGAAFMQLFKVAFGGIFAPRLFDTEHYTCSFAQEVLPEIPPLFLLGEGARLIRRLFIESLGEKIAVLPCLPTELHAGRFINISCDPDVEIDIEWSKKKLRCATLRPKKDVVRELILQKPLQSFRLRVGKKAGDRGKIFPVSRPLEMKQGVSYTLDRLQQ